MLIINKSFRKSFLVILVLSTSFVLFNNSGTAQKTEPKFKKKLYISTIKAVGVPASAAKRVKEGIRLAIFEGFGAVYQVLDDDAIKAMYKQAEAIMSSGCDDTSCITQIAEGINADEIVYGEVSQEGPKIAVSITDLERKGISIGTKSIVNLSFFESQLDYAASETAKKLMNPQYKIDISKAPSTQDIKLGGIEIKAVKGLDISVIQFKSEDETAGKIVEYSKSLVAEGDDYFNKHEYSQARDKYLDIIDRVKTTLSSDKQAKVKEYIDGVYKRVDSTYVMEFKPEIEKVDAWLKTIKEPGESDLEKGIKKYSSVEEDIRKIPDPYNGSREQLINAVYERKDSIHIAIISGYEKKGDSLYRDYKFADAMDWYNKSRDRSEKIENSDKKNENDNRIAGKLSATMKTGRGYLANRVKSLVDQAEFYNFQRNTPEAKSVMKDARKLITGSMIIFGTMSAIETFNNYANVIKMDALTVKDEPKLFEPIKRLKEAEQAEALWLASIEEAKIRKKKHGEYISEMAKKNNWIIKDIGGCKFVKLSGGSFMIMLPKGNGGGDGHLQRKVTVDGFWIGVYEVTQKQYQEIMGNNPSYFKGADIPVESVSWSDAMEFCKRFSEKHNVKTRLPYEAEWEYACRAGSTARYYWGNEMDDSYCWYDNNSDGKTHPVGEKKPNAWGIFDMNGNVYEWCMDWYDKGYYRNSPESNPEGPTSGSHRVLRGGSWSSNGNLTTSRFRFSNRPHYRTNGTGFRFVVLLR